MDFLLLIIAGIGIAIFLIQDSKKGKKRLKEYEQNDGKDPERHDDSIWEENLKQCVNPKNETSTFEQDIEFYKNGYVSQRLLTNNEWNNYKRLKKITDERGLIICPKVRLLDIIRPKNENKKYKSLLWKVQAKHIDFLICDYYMNIKAIIELDDRTHDRVDRKERDIFVDTILNSVGYTVIHTRYIDENTLKDI